MFRKKEFMTVALMLFAMFFGAGNFILPPMVGLAAGENFYLAILFFCFTGVALPVLGVAAVAKAGTLKELASRINPIFATIFVAVIYITIGPLLAIPRASNMPFDIMIKPYFDSSISLAIYTAIYFTINYLICLNPSKIIDTLGKILTPILLILILLFFVSTLVFTSPAPASATAAYATHPIATAFVEGYQTMDALAALVFGISVVQAVKTYGINDEQKLASITVKTGFFAGVILLIVYLMLGYIGSVNAANFKDSENGAVLLSNISNALFGDAGRFVLGITTLLACLTTTIGLIGSAASYFSSISKVPYKAWVFIWAFASFLIANLGLTQIIKISIPILIAIYPVAIVFIFLSLINHMIESSRLIYTGVVASAGVIGILNALDIAGLFGEGMQKALNYLPFYSAMLGWVVPVIVVFALLSAIYYIKKSDDDY